MTSQAPFAMIDLETLSTAKDAAIISVGVVTFDRNGIASSDGWALDLSKVTGAFNASTVGWWMKQNEAAKDFSFNGKEDPHIVAQHLITLLKGCDEVWANDPDFDHVILKSWWESLRPKPGPFPIHHRAARSFRTLCMLGRECGVDIDALYKDRSAAHNPIEDAAVQARVVIEVRKRITAGRGVAL